MADMKDIEKREVHMEDMKDIEKLGRTEAPHAYALSISRTIVLTIVGALAGWAIPHLYYVRALHDMKEADAEERRRVEELVFRGIESIGDIKYCRDPTGRVVGVAIELRGQAPCRRQPLSSNVSPPQRETVGQ